MTKQQSPPHSQPAHQEPERLSLPATSGLPAAALSALESQQLSAGKVERLDGLARGQLTEEGILAAARESWQRHGKIPTINSQEEVPGHPGDTWLTIYKAGVRGERGLPKGRTLARILQQLRNLDENEILRAAQEFKQIHGHLPLATSSEPVPGRPGDTWCAINMAGYTGVRGLAEGRTLAKILAPLRPTPAPITEEMVVRAAEEFERIHGRVPSAGSTEPVPGHPELTWKCINSAGTTGSRGLSEGRTLSAIVSPLRNFTEEEILHAARVYIIQAKKFPSAHNTDVAPNMQGLAWCGIAAAALEGRRGLTKGRKLSDILAPLRRLTEEDVLESANEHYRRHGKLPHGESNERVPNFPFLTWRNVNTALVQGKHGLAPGRSLAALLKPLRVQLKA